MLWVPPRKHFVFAATNDSSFEHIQASDLAHIGSL
jgi:hypothetical protein